MGFKKFVVGTTIVVAAAGGAGYKGVYEPNHLPAFIGVSDLPFNPPERLAATSVSGGETGLICAADTAPCTKANALGVMATSTMTVKTAFKDISPNFVTALVAVEDQRFFSNDGCDVQAIVRAFKDTAFSGLSRIEGASGITRQLVSKYDAAPRPKDRKTLEAVGKEGLECLQARYMEDLLTAKLGSKGGKRNNPRGVCKHCVLWTQRRRHRSCRPAIFRKVSKGPLASRVLRSGGSLNEPSNLDVNYGSELISPDKKAIYVSFIAGIREQFEQAGSAGSQRDVTKNAVDEAVAAGKLSKEKADIIKTYAGYIYESERAQNRFKTVVGIATNNNPKPEIAALLRPGTFPALKPYKANNPIGVSFKGADQRPSIHRFRHE